MHSPETNLRYYLYLAADALKEGIYNKAIAACELALEVDSNCVAAIMILGNCHYQKKNYEEASKLFERAFDLYPSTTNMVNLSLTAIQSSDGDFANVLKDTVFKPENTSTANELTAILLCKQGNYTEAEKYFELAVQAGVPRPRIYANYGTALLEKYLSSKEDINDVHRAIDKFNEAIDVAVFNKYAMYNRCRAYYTIGEYLKALKDAKELLRYDNEDSGYYYILARILIKLKKYNDAMKYATWAHWYGNLTNKYVASEATKLCREINLLTRK